MQTVKRLIAVIDTPGKRRDDLARAITCQDIKVFASNDMDHLPEDTALIVVNAAEVPSHRWSGIARRLPTLVVSDFHQDADLIKAVDIGLVDYIVQPLLHTELLRRMIHKAIELHQLALAREEDRARLAELNETLETHLALLRMDQQSGGHIQRRLLPTGKRQINDAVYDHWLAPSLYLSGDFLDYQGYDERYSVFYFADVSGHGASSAFVTVLLKYLCNRWLHEWDGQHPDQLPVSWLSALNRELQGTDIGKHATLFVGVIDHHQQVLFYSLGAQLPMPLLADGANLSRLTGEGMPVGLFPDVSYPALQCPLPARFTLWLCSDGILECLDGDTLEQRLDRLEHLVAISHSVSELRDHVAAETPLIEQAENADPDDGNEHQALPDDLTIMMVSGFEHSK